MKQFRIRYLQQVGEFRQLSFVPPDYFPRTPKMQPENPRRKSLEANIAKNETKKVLFMTFLLT